jgi:hypothetical protein
MQDDFKLLSGEPKSYKTSGPGTRQFCGECGTQLFFLWAESPTEMETTIASLDDPDKVQPEAHIYASSKLGFIKMQDGLPSFEAERQ